MHRFFFATVNIYTLNVWGLELIKRQNLSGPNVMATHMTHGEGLCTQKIEKLSWKKLRHLSFFENAPIPKNWNI